MKINGIKVLPALLIGGTQAFINPKTIDHTQWKKYSGKTLSGQQVQSPKVAFVQGTETVVIESEGGQFSMPQADFELLCAGGAKDSGYKVTPART